MYKWVRGGTTRAKSSADCAAPLPASTSASLTVHWRARLAAACAQQHRMAALNAGEACVRSRSSALKPSRPEVEAPVSAAQDSTARFCGTAVQAGAGRRFLEMFRRRNWRSSLPTQDELCNALARDGRVDPFPVASLPRQRSAHMYMFMCMSLVVNTREVPWLPLVVNTVEVP